MVVGTELAVFVVMPGEAELAEDVNRRLVADLNRGDQPRKAELLKGEIHERRACLCGKTAAPIGASQIERECALAGDDRIGAEVRVDTAVADVLRSGLQNGGPEPETIGNARKVGGPELALGLGARPRVAAHEATNIRVRLHGAEGFEITDLVISKQ